MLTTHEGGEVHDVVIRLAGDSGDGMQLTGDRLSAVSAESGNDLATLPDFPAEIRAPAGTPHGVSAFQVRISDHPVTTPGDAPMVLVAMNPAEIGLGIPAEPLFRSSARPDTPTIRAPAVNSRATTWSRFR